MISKICNFLEAHAEKLVLAVVGLICLWILTSWVIISPNRTEYKSQKFGPGQIDNFVVKKAEQLEAQLAVPVTPKDAYEPKSAEFLALLGQTIDDVDPSLYCPKPYAVNFDLRAKGKYVLPEIGDVNDVKAGHIRAVAYVPTEEVSLEVPYETAKNEPNDVDFITVEAKFDVQSLYASFYEAFAGDAIKEEERDPCLAIPVFGAVELERQEQLADGSWTKWQSVPRSKIDWRRDMLEVIENVKDLPTGGMKVRLMEFGEKEVQMDILQPMAYQIASASEEWFPPALHERYSAIMEDIKIQEKRDRWAKEKQEREEERERIRSERESRKDTRTTAPIGGGGGGMMGEMGFGGGMMGGGGGMPTPKKPRTSRRDRRKERDTKDSSSKLPEKDLSTDEIYEEFDAMKLDKKKEISDLEESLVFWALDDTVEPGGRYRYRIRLGVLNPIAGTERFKEESMAKKDDVVLWSKYSDVTEAVEVPQRLYFFARDIQQAARSVTVQVSKYVLGYWYSQSFTVNQGESIGKIVEYEAKTSEEVEGAEQLTLPEEIDFSTGAIYVDAAVINQWTGGSNLRQRVYSEMLFSYDGVNIAQMPISPTNWPSDLMVVYNEIKKTEKEPKEPLRPWESRGGRQYRGRRGPGMMGDMEGGDMMMDMMMMPGGPEMGF